jgi:hypothetical protein
MIKARIYMISPSIVEIRIDEHKYARFAQNGQLRADSMLEYEN